ncbi:MAG TPA: cob(I)yrinic acid a,c-diamide adenosyltransferase, partial [Bacteroidetes bacterium]|nr:cob(I)yrinic acid a,c-diamide adenosyltransferase [Bacteroidota bacterium]
GTVDELNSAIGVVISSITDEQVINSLFRIQKRLFDLGAILATNPDKPQLMMPFNEKEILFLENSIDEMEKQLPELKNFILPSGSLSVSYIHVARTICRRAERRVVAVPDETGVYSNLIVYLNRLSDFLFVLARKIAHDTGTEEILWDNNEE